VGSDENIILSIVRRQAIRSAPAERSGDGFGLIQGGVALLATALQKSADHQSRFYCIDSGDIIRTDGGSIAMETLKPSWEKGRRFQMSMGLVIAFLIGLSSAGTFWPIFPVTKAQAPQGHDASYDTEVQKGVTMLRRHLWEDALKAFKRANEMRNKQSAECFYGMAQAYQGLRAYKNVLESCDRVIELSVNDPRTQAQAYNLKGIALQTQAENKDQKKLQEAEAAFRQGLALGTGLPILQYNLGFTLLQQGRDPEGIVELRKFVEL
jgi:tetratricopeptide (TPR) repeat protein